MKIKKIPSLIFILIISFLSCTKTQDWGNIKIEKTNGKIEVVLENSEFRARYKNSITSFAQRNPVCIAEFYNKKAGKELVAGGRWDDILDPVDFGGDPFRPKFLYRDRLLSAKIIHDGPDKKTVHLNWENTEEKVTIFPNSPVIQIDYIRWFVLFGDWSDWPQHPEAYKEQMFVVYGADDYYKTYDPNDTTRIRGLEDDEVYYSKRHHDPEDGGPLNYNGHFIVGTYKIESGAGFGRILPVDRTRSFKLWRWRGWEVFPLGDKPFTTYLFTVSNGADEIISLGKKIVDSYPPVKDVFPPEVIKVTSLTPNSISIEFNEQIDSVTAVDINNYKINNNITVQNIQFNQYPNRVDLNTSPLKPGTNCVIQIKAVKDLSGIKINPHSIDYKIPIHPPVYNIASGLYDEKQLVSISSYEADSQIRYTLDGSDPTEQSTLYKNELEIDSPTVIKASVFKNGYSPGDVSEIDIKLKVTVPETNRSFDIYSEPQTLELSCANKNASIRYTTDRSSVTESSSLYTKPINITENMLIKTKAFYKDWESSKESYVFFMFVAKEANKAFSKSVAVNADIKERTASVKINNDLTGKVKIRVMNKSGRVLDSFEFEKDKRYFFKRLEKLRFGLFFIEISMDKFISVRTI